MKKYLFRFALIVPLVCFSITMVGCSQPAEVKAGSANAQASFGPAVGENELGEKGPDGTAFVN